MRLRTTIVASLLAVCGGLWSPRQARAESTLPAEWTLAGQAKTCEGGPRHRTFALTAVERVVDLGMDMKADVMVFDGAGRMPMLEACQGDTITIAMKNAGKMAHGLDSHAFFMSPERFGPVEPGKSLTLTGEVNVPGSFMFHCASGPVTDVHIKSGMFGAMIVYPRQPLRPAREVAVLQGGLWGEPDAQGLITTDSTRTSKNDPYALLFNGRLEHEMVHVRPGELVRVYFVNAGPGSSAVHVMGTMLDRFYASGNPRNVEYEVQTGLVPAGGGATFEFRIPDKGMYMLVDHDNLRFLPLGMAIPFMAD